MSSTALVRSPSSSSSLIATATRSKSTIPTASAPLTRQNQDLTPQRKSTFIPSSNTPNSVGTPTPNKPQQQTPQPLPPATAVPTPGRWQHPRLSEIITRQNRTSFDKTNVYACVWNTGVIALSFILSASTPTAWHQALRPYSSYTILLLRLFLLSNIFFALAPLFRQADPCEDIPLTPTQRQLFGLPPMTRPATPQEQEQYVTPPRYSRSATPRSTSSSLQPEISGSPLSSRGGSDSPLAFGTPNGSPAASLLGNGRGRRGSGAEQRRLSYNGTSNRSSPLTVSEFDALGSVSTPTKGNNRASLGLNNKWLYEKGKTNASAWGSGSVFS